MKHAVAGLLLAGSERKVTRRNLLRFGWWK